MALHLVVPALLATRHGIAEGRVEHWPCMERLLSRSDRLPGPAGFAETLFALFDLAPPADADLPTAPLCYLGDSGQRPEAFLFHADPVHLVADQDRLLLFRVPAGELSPDVIAPYLAAFNSHFAADGLELLAPLPARWYLRLGVTPQLRTTPLAAVVGRNVDPYLPLGRDAPTWRRLLNEVQMLFHPLAAAATAAVPVNGLWVSGGGYLPATACRSVLLEQGDHPLVRGLALLGTSSGLEQPLRLRVDDSLLSADLDGDAGRRVASLRHLESELSLLGGEELLLYPCSGGVYHWRPRHRWRWWRRSLPLGRHPAT